MHPFLPSDLLQLVFHSSCESWWVFDRCHHSNPRRSSPTGSGCARVSITHDSSCWEEGLRCGCVLLNNHQQEHSHTDLWTCFVCSFDGFPLLQDGGHSGILFVYNRAAKKESEPFSLWIVWLFSLFFAVRWHSRSTVHLLLRVWRLVKSLSPPPLT